MSLILLGLIISIYLIFTTVSYIQTQAEITEVQNEIKKLHNYIHNVTKGNQK